MVLVIDWFSLNTFSQEGLSFSSIFAKWTRKGSFLWHIHFWEARCIVLYTILCSLVRWWHHVWYSIHLTIDNVVVTFVLLIPMVQMLSFCSFLRIHIFVNMSLHIIYRNGSHRLRQIGSRALLLHHWITISINVWLIISRTHDTFSLHLLLIETKNLFMIPHIYLECLCLGLGLLLIYFPVQSKLICSFFLQNTVDTLILLLDWVLALVHLLADFATVAGSCWIRLVVELVAQSTTLVLTACHGHDLVLRTVLLEVAVLGRADAFLWRLGQ